MSRLSFVHAHLSVPMSFRASPAAISDTVSCRRYAEGRLHFVQSYSKLPTQSRASPIPISDLLSCKLRLRPLAPNADCCAALCHFGHKTARICNILCLSGTERRQGLWRASQRQRAVPWTHRRKKTHMRLVRSLPIPAPHPRTDLHGFKSDFFSEAPLRTPAPKTNKKIFRLLHVFVHQTTSERGYIGAPVPPASDPARPPSSVFARMDTPDTRKGRLPPRIFVCKGARIVICLH